MNELSGRCFVVAVALALGAHTSAGQKEISDAFANAQIAAAKEAEAASILKEVEALKQAGKYQDGAEKLREILPLSPDLFTATIIRASQALDSLLVKWQMSSEGAHERTPRTSGEDRKIQDYDAWQRECKETQLAISQFQNDKSRAEREQIEFERKQQENRTLGAEWTRLQMRNKIMEIQAQLQAKQIRYEELIKNKPAPPSSKALTQGRARSEPKLQPWKYYEKLQTDFREAVREAKLRDSKRR